MLTLVKGAKNQLVIKPTQGSWGIRNIGRTIHSMIGEKAFIQCAKMLKFLDLIFIEQLLDMQGKQMITSIENQMIINFNTREIKQDLQTSSTNKLALIPQKVKVSEDKRKLDWILVNNKENKPDIRRVVSKSKEGFRTENSFEGIRKNNIDTEITSRREIGKDLYSLKHASLADIVYIDKLERDYIKKQGFGEYCEELLLNQLDRNIETDKKTLTFYIDGSLLKETRNRRANQNPNKKFHQRTQRYKNCSRIENVKYCKSAQAKRQYTEVGLEKSMEKNQISKQSVLDINTKRKKAQLPDQESSCKLCKDNIEETQDHLAYYRAQQTHWQKIEQAAIEAVQALINKPEKRENYKQANSSDAYLVKFTRSKKTKKETNLALDTTIHVLWNSFHKIIWRSRCKKIIKWEKEKDISKQQKLGKRAKLQDKKKVSRKRRREKTEAQKSSDQKSRKLPNPKETM
ncbi:10349_t:CDS:2, partial [Dentiscutata erythropus]